MPSSPPTLSVIIPVRNGMSVLPAALDALNTSDLPPGEWEVIVVDDGSTDGTENLAPRANRLLRLDESRGPGYARNRGSALARGEILVFLDADVCVHPATLRLLLCAFRDAADVGAVFGAYDTEPAAPGFISQYRNLLHHHTHLRGAGDAETFWAGCGAVRRHVFAEVGGFDAGRYRRPQIEDIELGHRIRDLGYRILLRPDIQATHLKKWSLGGGIVTDVRDRGIPWSRLLLADDAAGYRRSTLNIRTQEKVFTGMAAAAPIAGLFGIVSGRSIAVAVAALLVLGVIAGNAALLQWFAARRGVSFALAVIPLRILYYILNAVSAMTAWVQHSTDRLWPQRSSPPGMLLRGVETARPPETA
jgi:hypothetical protein